MLWCIILSVLSSTCTLEVQHVVDGDTFHVTQGDTIRLWGMDTPELHGENHKEALKAKEHLSSMVLGEHIECSFKDRDRYDRVVMQCFLKDSMKDIGCSLVQEGYANDWPRFSEGAYADLKEESSCYREVSSSNQ